jgi:MOSC domain-containing protein
MRFLAGIEKGKLVEVWNSVYPDNTASKPTDYLTTQKTDCLSLSLEGIQGERHFGTDYKTGKRLRRMYKPGTMIRNNRQWSAISPAEMKEITGKLSLPGPVTPGLLGINIVISGLGVLNRLPPMTYLVFSHEAEFEPGREGDVVLVVFGGMGPCKITGRVLADYYQNPDLATAFPKKAIGFRGTTGWIEKGGLLAPGMFVFKLTPTGQV